MIGIDRVDELANVMEWWTFAAVHVHHERRCSTRWCIWDCTATVWELKSEPSTALSTMLDASI